MSDYFVGEIRLFPFARVPRGWAPCNGQTLAINQNAALFALLNFTFGGNGTTTFNLPDLRGRTPCGTSTTLNQGAVGGAESVALTVSQLPPHTHNVLVNSTSGTTPLDTGDFLATNAAGAAPGATAFNVFAPLTNTNTVPLASVSVTPAGTGTPHENRQPSLAMAYCIALSGIFPSRG